MVLLPEEAEMTLAELRQVASKQQNQIEMQQQLLIVKEQRLKFLKQQEARHHLTEQNIESTYLHNLKEKVEAQELKLRKLRALHGQVEQQKTNNCNLGAELESVRALFSEKEKELSIAVSKVEELTRQLNEVRKNTTRKPAVTPLAVNEIEDLRRELMYRTKLTEQQNHHISQQRSVLTERQRDMSQLDDKISELTQRLRRKRLMNQQLANQIHNAALARHSNPSNANTHSSINIAAVEPIQRELLQDPDQTRDDLAAKLSSVHQNDLYEFSLKKNDPKYQTLPYNTKFYLKGKDQDDTSQAEDESSDSLSDAVSGNMQDSKASSESPIPHPFGNSLATRPIAPAAKPPVQLPEKNKTTNVATTKSTAPVQIVSALPETFNNAANNNHSSGDEVDAGSVVQINKQKFMGKIQSFPDYKKTKEKFNGAVVKPVVPPKPTFPVKPVPPPRQTPTKESPHSDDKGDVVSKAISVLQNRSSETEKNAFSNYKERLLYYRYVSRYNSHKGSGNEGSAADSKVVTYFPMPSGQPKSSANIQDNVRKKPSSGQLPIKPKPLTIRKTPGLEPPKLKVQQSSNQFTAYRKTQDAHVLSSSSFKPITVPSVTERPHLADANSLPIQGTAGCKSEIEETSFENVPKQIAVETKMVPSITVEEAKTSDTETLEHAKNDEKHSDRFQVPEREDSDTSSSSPCDSLECMPVHSASEGQKSESTNGTQELSFNTYHRVKGNLKTEASVRSPRRVSFDPLALLLDAALEGELELVKKTTHEVPNPSAANDEGITALHNSICAGHFEVVTFLVEFGCDVNAQDSDGWTPLHCAASCNNLPMVQFLVERGACIFATTLSDRETAAEKCEEDEEGFDGCSEYLYGLQENLGIINNGVVYAVYDYEGQNSDELSFKDGNTITVLRNGDEQEKEWWWARLNDEEGYIPRNLVGLYPRISVKKD